jgi:sec-independent protein translocase protein TatC
MAGGLKIVEHIDELRRRLKVVFISLVVSILLVLLFPLNPSQILNLSATYYETPTSVFLHLVLSGTLPSSFVLIPFTIGTPLEILMLAAVILGILVDMPVIVYEVYRFIDPALKPEERRMVYPVIISATVLFAIGILFGYFVLARFIFVAMVPFYTAIGLHAPYYIAASDFFTIVFLCVLFCGFAFITPVFVFLVLRFGIVSPNAFKKYRLYIWFATYIITAIITPDGGPLLDLLLFIPVITMLELSVIIGGRFSPRRHEGEGKCRFCGEEWAGGPLFCPSCGKSSR